MIYRNINELREKINQNGASSTPFLFALNYEMSEGVLVEEPNVQSDLFFEFLGHGNKPTDHVATQSHTFATHPIAFEQYARMFDTVWQASVRGQAQVTNLTVRTPIETNLSLADIFALGGSKYQLYMPGRFVCFSPERFVLIGRGRISTNPMKGTIDASIPNAEHEILSDPKELAEHTATVELMVGELARVASNVRVERFRYIDRIETNNKCLLQVSSEVVGELPDDYIEHLGDLVFSLLPAGSIAGSPKEQTLELIRRAEGMPRGYYCGVAGYFDGETLDTAVLIRFIEQQGDQFYFRSGGGVTAKSDCQKEYREVQNKIYLPFV